MPRLDRRAVLRGALVYLVITAPCVVAIAAISGHNNIGSESGAWLALVFVLLLVAPLLGGAEAARCAPPAPLTHAAVAVALPAGALIIVRLIIGAASGSLTGRLTVSLLLFLCVFTSIAMLGGYIVFRARQRRAS
jgi:hypothetical protein